MTALLRLHVIVERSVPDADGKARQLLDALCRRLAQVFSERSAEALSRRREELTQAEEQVKQAEQRLAQVQELQQKLYAEAGQTELSQAAVLADLQGWEREQQEREAKLAALHARQNALLEQIARIGQEIKTRAQEDPVAIELQKVVELRERALAKTRELAKQGLVSSDDEVAAGEERLALARAELAKQRQAASLAAGGSLLADLNKDVVSLAADIAESEARREYFRGRMAQAREQKLLELANRYEGEVGPQLKAAEQGVRIALDRRLEAEEQLARCRPATVTVLGAGGEQQSQSPKR
jgi:DNA repair exonuclease SbcCD ATPase subunit